MKTNETPKHTRVINVVNVCKTDPTAYPNHVMRIGGCDYADIPVTVQEDLMQCPSGLPVMVDGDKVFQYVYKAIACNINCSDKTFQ